MRKGLRQPCQLKRPVQTVEVLKRGQDEGGVVVSAFYCFAPLASR